MKLTYWLLRPRMALARLRYLAWELNNTDKPWMCPNTIRFCQSHLNPTMQAIEFGSGRSTLWFSSRVARLISIEHNPLWYEKIASQLDQSNTRNVDYRLVPLNHPESAPEQLHYPQLPNYVAVADSLPDQSLDLAIVDGHYRTNCIRHLIPKIAPGGFLLVDDINMWPNPQSLEIPPHWPIADDSTNGIKRCIIWQAP